MEELFSNKRPEYPWQMELPPWAPKAGMTEAERRADEARFHFDFWKGLLDEDGLPDGTLEELARIIAKCWEAALSEAYPSRAFEVRVSAGNADYGPTVSFASMPR